MRRWARGSGVRHSLLAALLATTGCTAPWALDRAKDLGEVLDFTLTGGAGMSVSLRATEAFQAGLGSFDGWTVGWLEGRPVRVREQRSEFGLLLFHFHEYRRRGEGQLLDVHHPRFGDPGYRQFFPSFLARSDRRFFDVGAGLHLAYLGVNFALHLDQFADFCTGLFGYDLLEDDAFVPSLEELRRRAASPESGRARDAAFDALQRRDQPIFGYGVYTAADARPRFQRLAIQQLKESGGVEDSP